jgi:hypothetical protein
MLPLLPTSLLNEVYMNWLSTKDLVQLDTSLCNAHTRADFFQVISAHYFRTEGFVMGNTQPQALQWFIKRRTRVNSLTIMEESGNAVMPWLQMSFFFRDLRTLKIKHKPPIDRHLQGAIMRILCHNQTTLQSFDGSTIRSSIGVL